MDWTSVCIVVVIVVLCIAPTAVAVPPRVEAPPAVVHTVPAHRAGGTRRTGTGTISTGRQRAIILWKRATAYILRVLRLRRKWALLGRHLATQRVQDLVVGLSRKTGTLTRIYDPAFAVPAAKGKWNNPSGRGLTLDQVFRHDSTAKVRAQPSRRTPAAAADSD